jgi:MerR family transcriptional regulator, light-induced transcriptional regulator
MAAGEDPAVRIGELGRRVGVSSELLRAWERRYGLLRPTRTDGGFRLYSGEDERRVRLMQRHLARGVAAAEAAQLALAETSAREGGSGWENEASVLAEALESFEEQAAQLTLDRLLAAVTVETVLTAVVLPYLHELGRRWESGEVSIAQEHFASNLLRGRLHGLARGWDRGAGPRALLACAPGEQHDLPLIVFGIALHGHGWRITFLGPDTPIETVAETASRISPELIVLTAVDPGRFEAVADMLRKLASDHTLVLAGSGASEVIGARVGCAVRRDDPVSAAEQLAAGVAAR